MKTWLEATKGKSLASNTPHVGIHPAMDEMNKGVPYIDHYTNEGSYPRPNSLLTTRKIFKEK